MTAEAKAIYEAILEHGPRDTVLPIGVAHTSAWNYAFTYELFQRWFPEVLEQARSIKRSEARWVLVQRYIDNVVAADRRMIAKVFHILK
jgi:hypothetical protein